MIEPFRYAKKRKDFERPAAFEDSDLKHLGGSVSDESLAKYYTHKNPNYLVLDNIPTLSTHEVNTERVVTATRNMKHEEGGWPREVDYNEEHETNKWRTRKLKDELFATAVKELHNYTDKSIKQNNQINVFEEYFLGEKVDHSTETLSAKTLMLFKDPCEIKRGISKIAWCPDGPGNKIAVAYSINRFQKMPERMPMQSYIWDMNAPNTACKTLIGSSPLCSIAFNNKYTDYVVGGCYNGLMAVWDLREKDQPIWQTEVEKSHYEPVFDVYWLHGKSGSEFVSCSSDGRMMWWDFRKEGEPYDYCTITDGVGGDEEKILGGTALEYNPDAGATKFLCGTEQGYAVLANKKPQKSPEISHRYGVEAGKHGGPIYNLQRNPEESKCFLTVGDWCAKVWSEEIPTPIMTTRCHDTYLTDGCWSPTRPGVFVLSQMDGWLHVWDYYYRQNEIAFSHKVSDKVLTNVTIQNQPNAGKYGSLVGVGDSEGTVTLIELCDSLSTLQSNEKTAIKNMFEREYTREKNLRAAKRQAEGKKTAKKDDVKENGVNDKLQEELRKLEEAFFEKVGVDESEKHTNGNGKQREPTPPRQEETVQEVPPQEPVQEVASQDPVQEASQEPAEETPQEPLQEAPQEPAEETPQDPVQETPQEPAEETPQEPAEETPQDPVQETPQEPPQEAPQEPAEEAPQEEAKNGEVAES